MSDVDKALRQKWCDNPFCSMQGIKVETYLDNCINCDHQLTSLIEVMSGRRFR
jgi:hypothetical protein